MIPSSTIDFDVLSLEDIEISNIEEGRALNSWLIGLFLMLEVILVLWA
jgi:hypothetical protein